MSDVLHVLDHSLPEQDGYAFRSHAILRALRARGMDVAALTGPKQGPARAELEDIDGIRYLRTPARGAPPSTPSGQLRTIWSTRTRIARLLRADPTPLLHAHSPCLNGLAALGHGRPLLYEMRASWEDAAVSSGTTAEGSIRYRLSRALETTVASRASQIVVICAGLKKELAGRGIPEGKITVVPNAVSAHMLELADDDARARIRARHGLTRARIVGFFGSFFEWEGLELLTAALPRVAAAVPDVRLLLAGGGRQEAELQRRVRRLGLERHVVFAGRISHDEVRGYYAAADVMAYPRLRHRLTDMVTPLKPLEAMAQRRPVVASDVGGHTELIEHGRTGFLFPAGDAEALARELVSVLSGGAQVAAVVEGACRQVWRRHRWAAVAALYEPVYARLLARVGSAEASP